MGSLLIDRWLAGADAELVADAASVAVVRERVRSQGAALGPPAPVTESMVNVASELGHNQLAHGRAGRIAVVALVRDGVAGIEVIAADRGEGVGDPTAAVRGELRFKEGRSSLGFGLASVVELADEVDFDIRAREGTCVRARKFGEPVARRREVGIYGRPFPGEPESGDDAAFVRDGDALLLALADGLGHGPAAREASSVAIETTLEYDHLSFGAIFEECHRALAETRGSVLALARVHEGSAALETSSVGNVAAHLYGFDRSRRFGGLSFVLGLRGGKPRYTTEKTALARGDVLVMFTDGLSQQADIEGELDLLREHPIVIAHQLAMRFARGTDDALVVVAR